MAVSLALKLVVVVALAFLTANQPADNKNMHNNCPETGMMMPIPKYGFWSDDHWVCATAMKTV